MSFAVKLDENLSRVHVDLLRQAGYDVDRVDEQGLSGATDERVWERVCTDGRFFITLDLDFSDIRRYQPGTHPGILLIRARSRRAFRRRQHATENRSTPDVREITAEWPRRDHQCREHGTRAPRRDRDLDRRLHRIQAHMKTTLLAVNGTLMRGLALNANMLAAG